MPPIFCRSALHQWHDNWTTVVWVIYTEFFCKLDTNGDGCLDFHEIQAGFKEVFGVGSMEVADVEDMFDRLDLDGSGKISYTEFCAAGIGESRYTQEHAVWAAFKSFDLTDSGRITRETMRQVLQNARVDQIWLENFCEGVALEAMERFGVEDGSMNFDEWLSLIHYCSSAKTNFTC